MSGSMQMWCLYSKKETDATQIGVEIGVNSERTIDLLCRFSFLVSQWQCDRSVRIIVSRFSFLVPRLWFIGGSATGP